MKTLFVCSERKVNNHVGEFYDEIIEVPHQPVSTEMPELARKVKAALRQLWKQDVDDKERKDDPCVAAHLDAASPFNAMLQDFQYVLEKEENIKVILPYLPERRTGTADPEAQEMLKKLQERSAK